MKYLFAGAGLALAVAGCGEGAQSMAGESVAAEAAEEVTPTMEEGEAAADAPTADNGRVTLSGPVSSLALDVNPVMVTMTPDGAEREVFLEITPAVARAFERTWEGVGHSGAFECASQDSFEAEDGTTYDIFSDCRLASEGAGSTRQAEAQAPSGPQIPEAFRGVWDSWRECRADSGGLIRVDARRVTYSDSYMTITSVRRIDDDTVELSGVSGDPSVGNESFGYTLDEGGKRMWWHGPDHSPIRLDRCPNLAS